MQEIDYLQGAAEKARQNKSEETKQSSDQTQLWHMLELSENLN